MGFTFEFINQSNYDVPLQKYNVATENYNYSDRNVVVDGITHTIKAIALQRDTVIVPIAKTTDIAIPSTYYAVKFKDKELYLVFYIYSYNYPTLYINTYLTNNLADPTQSQIYGNNYYNYSQLYEVFMFINTYDNTLCMGSNVIGRRGETSQGWTGVSLQSLIDNFGELDGEIISPEYGNASSSGGYGGGSFDNSSDTIGIPQSPTIGVTNVGFVNVYKTSLNSLQNLGSELFPDFTPPQPSPLGSDVAEMLQLGFNNLVENIVNFSNMYINSNLINYVIDCHCLPISPSVGESENIKIGFKEFTQSANKVTSDYVDFDCGTLNIGEYYTNFIDYVGTRAKLYLPFIGFVDIQPEYFQSGTLQVIYRFNIIDGSFMAYVLSSSSKSQLRNSVIASYGGNACVHIPITGINYSNMISSVLNGATSIVSGQSKGQVDVNTALDTLASKPPMQSSNGYNATSAYLGIRYPYLIIEREVSNFSEKYTNEYGLPCNITKTINELSGFIQMDNIHLETLSCTDDEKTLIQNLLQNGIIV